MGNLDGSDKIIPTPFDAHEQVVRGPHEHTKDGYKPKAKEEDAPKIKKAETKK